jgi:hypothetical protein
MEFLLYPSENDTTPCSFFALWERPSPYILMTISSCRGAHESIAGRPSTHDGNQGESLMHPHRMNLATLPAKK